MTFYGEGYSEGSDPSQGRPNAKICTQVIGAGKSTSTKPWNHLKDPVMFKIIIKKLCQKQILFNLTTIMNQTRSRQVLRFYEWRETYLWRWKLSHSFNTSEVFQVLKRFQIKFQNAKRRNRSEGEKLNDTFMQKIIKDKCSFHQLTKS